MKNKNLLDQFFLVDENLVKEMALVAKIEKDDTIMEIGAGRGIVTKEIAKKAGKVIAIEIDKKFKDDLQKLPGNVEIIFGNALDFIIKKKVDKLIGSLPSSIVEPLMLRLPKADFKMAVFLIPLKFLRKIDKGYFSVYLKTDLINKIDKSAFSPQPKTNWALVKIEKKEDPLKEKDYKRFIEKYIYEHPSSKLKNSLTEAVIKISSFFGKKLTKNEARKIIFACAAKEDLERSPERFRDYSDISSCLLGVLETKTLR